MRDGHYYNVEQGFFKLWCEQFQLHVNPRGEILYKQKHFLEIYGFFDMQQTPLRPSLASNSHSCRT